MTDAEEKPVVIEQVKSIDPGEFISLRKGITNIMARGGTYSKKTTETFNKLADPSDQYQSIDRLLDRVEELNLKDDVKEPLTNVISREVIKYKQEHPSPQTLKNFVESFDPRNLEREFYEDALSTLTREFSIYERNTSLYTLEDLRDYYKTVCTVTGQTSKSYAEQAKKDFISEKVSEALISLHSIEIEANVEFLHPKRKLHSLYIESFYNHEERNIGISITYYCNIVAKKPKNPRHPNN